MKLPNKVISYNESDFRRSIIVLDTLEVEKLGPIELYEKTKKHFETIGEVIDILDFLFLLNIIDYSEEEGVLYVVWNCMW